MLLARMPPGAGQLFSREFNRICVESQENREAGACISGHPVILWRRPSDSKRLGGSRLLQALTNARRKRVDKKNERTLASSEVI
jgi:hypothetical protein